jgi:hypothetical protein
VSRSAAGPDVSCRTGNHCQPLRRVECERSQPLSQLRLPANRGEKRRSRHRRPERGGQHGSSRARSPSGLRCGEQLADRGSVMDDGAAGCSAVILQVYEPSRSLAWPCSHRYLFTSSCRKSIRSLSPGLCRLLVPKCQSKTCASPGRLALALWQKRTIHFRQRDNPSRIRSPWF